MGKRKLTAGAWKMENDQLEQLKDLLIHWLKPIPASEFSQMSQKLEREWDDEFGESKNYSDRWGKTCFLDEIRCADSLGKIREIFSWINNGLDPIEVFLCSKLATSHATITEPLVALLEEENVDRNRIEFNYRTIINHGLKNVCAIDDCGIYAEKRGLKLFTAVPPNNQLTELEGIDIATRYLLAYSPQLEHKWVNSAAGEECYKKQQERNEEAGTRQWLLPETLILPANLSVQQKALLAQIEAETCAQVILWQNNVQSFSGVLSYPPLPLNAKAAVNANGQLDKFHAVEYGRLCYVKIIIPQTMDYPASVLHEFEILDKNKESKQWLSSCSTGISIEVVLKKMKDYAQLLNKGWSLRNSIKFFTGDPILN